MTSPKQVEIRRRNRKRPLVGDGEPMVSRRTFQYGQHAGTVLRWEWHGGEYIEVFMGDADTPFEVVNTTDKDGVVPEFTARNFGAEIKAGPSMRELIRVYEAAQT